MKLVSTIICFSLLFSCAKKSTTSFVNSSSMDISMFKNNNEVLESRININEYSVSISKTPTLPARSLKKIIHTTTLINISEPEKTQISVPKDSTLKAKTILSKEDKAIKYSHRSLIYGIISLIPILCGFGIPALILGFISLRKLKRLNAASDNISDAKMGILFGMIGCAVLLMVLIYVFWNLYLFLKFLNEGGWDGLGSIKI